MADVQIAVIDPENTQLALAAPAEAVVNVAVPGVQGPIGLTGSVTIAQAGTAATPGIRFESDTNTGIYSLGADQLAVATNGTGRLFIDASGRVGIGTSAPGQLLDVVNGTGRIRTGGKDGSNIYLRLASTDVSNSMELQFSNSTNNNWQIQSIENGVSYRPLILNPAAGNVGIGTTSPDHQLVVQQDSGATEIVINAQDGTSAANLRYRSAGTTIAQVGASGSNLLFSIGTTERARIDSSGRLLVGTSSAYQVESGFSQTSQQIVGGDPLALLRYSANAGHVTSWFCKSRNATAGQHTVLQANDGISRFNFQGSDGTNFVTAARIEAAVDGTPGANDMPGRLVFSTTADGAATPTERLRITSTGRVGIGTSAPRFALSIGSITGLGTATPDTIDLGATFSTTSGTNPKLRIFQDAGDASAAYGFGVSTSQLDYMCPVNTSHVFYTGGTEKLRITSAGVLQIAEAGNITVGTTTGTKIGTATTQKLGFYNATPVVQPTAVANATDAATVITQLNALLTRMRNLGLIAT